VILLISHWLENKLPEMLDYVHHLGMLALVETEEVHLTSNTCPVPVPALIGMNNKILTDLKRKLIGFCWTGRWSKNTGKAGRALLISGKRHRQPEDVINLWVPEPMPY